MRKYACDRCEADIPVVHDQVEIDNMRYDVCGGECLKLVGQYKSELEKFLLQQEEDRRRFISDLVDKYWIKKSPAVTRTYRLATNIQGL